MEIPKPADRQKNRTPSQLNIREYFDSLLGWENVNSIRRARHYFADERARIGSAVILLLLSTAAAAFKPWPLALLVDHVLLPMPFPGWVPEFFKATPRGEQIAWLAGALLVFHAAQGILSAAQNYVSIKAGLGGLARVRQELFEHLQRLSLRYLNTQNQGDLIYRATWDSYAFQTLFQQGFFGFLTAMVSLLVMIAVMCQLNLLLTLLAISTVPFLLLTMTLFGRVMKEKSLSAAGVDSRLTSLLQQSIVAHPLIQSYTAEEQEKGKFLRQKQESFSRRASQHGWEVAYWLIVAVIIGTGSALLAWFGGREVLANRLSVGELLIFLAYLAQLYEPLNQLSRLGATVSDASAGIQRVYEILDAKDEIRQASHPKPLPPGGPGEGAQGGIEVQFDHVSFSYMPDRPVLRDISLRVPAGRSAALIGPSGAGKTTLLQLLPRFYDPVEGAIRCNGLDLRELAVADLRRQVGFGMQEALLLPCSIRDNIAFGRPEASLDEIKAAAAAANAHCFIESMPEKYDTVAGEGGARLSVGEKQRISLARAFLKNAPILLLDEPTSALDADTEKLVVESLRKLMQNRTTFIVAHRMSTIREVDALFVLEQGRIVESGSPAELAGKGGYYTRAKAN